MPAFGGAGGAGVLAQPVHADQGLIAAGHDATLAPADYNLDMARHAPNWMKWVLIAAAGYNLAWGGWVVLFPTMGFELAGLPPPRYPQTWQCVGMIVGVYGVGYAIAALDPLRHWPIVLVGLLGKVLGPIGFIDAAVRGTLPWSVGWTILTNDLAWWVPFGIILLRAWSIGPTTSRRATHATEPAA